MPGRLGGTPKIDLKRDPVPEPMGAVSPAPFYAIFGKNGAKMGTPIFLKIADEVFLRWPKTSSRAENSKNKEVQKGTGFGIRFGIDFGRIFKRN